MFVSVSIQNKINIWLFKIRVDTEAILSKKICHKFDYFAYNYILSNILIYERESIIYGLRNQVQYIVVKTSYY